MSNFYILKKYQGSTLGTLGQDHYTFDDFYLVKKDNSQIFHRKGQGYKVRTLSENFSTDKAAITFAKDYFISLKKYPKPIKVKVYGHKSQLMGSYIYGKNRPLKFTEKQLWAGDGYRNKNGTPCMKAHIYYWYLQEKMYPEARRSLSGRKIPNRNAHLKSKEQILGSKHGGRA